MYWAIHQHYRKIDLEAVTMVKNSRDGVMFINHLHSNILILACNTLLKSQERLAVFHIHIPTRRPRR